jgi:cell division protein FtsQ
MWNNARQLNGLANTLGSCAVFALLGAAVYWLMQRPMFALRAVQIDGDMAHVSLPTARAALAGQLRGNFFTVDIGAVRTALETMPWVSKASVRRRWPDRLEVELVAYRALGTWDEGQLLSVNGESFTANQDEAESEAGGALPAFGGPPGSEKEMAARYRDFVRWFTPLEAKVRRIKLSARNAWTVWLSNGIRIELGRDGSLDDEPAPDMLAMRSRRLAAAWAQIARQWTDKVEYIDLRYPNGFAIQVSDKGSGKGRVQKTSNVIPCRAQAGF